MCSAQSSNRYLPRPDLPRKDSELLSSVSRVACCHNLSLVLYLSSPAFAHTPPESCGPFLNRQSEDEGTRRQSQRSCLQFTLLLSELRPHILANMPGILPMKMIRVGSSASSRIAQACDRCRSKKIRCDGVRPTCTQCSNVGFECKTSDKLSRRAFPRGYTESLEDRVRGLEAEIRELKDLLDEKDEKLDMLSRIHSFSPSSRKCSASLSPSQAVQVKAEVESAREDVLHVEIPAPVQPRATLTGSSTTPSFIEAFDQKIQETGRHASGISSSRLQKAIQPTRRTISQGPKVPPRIASDQYISEQLHDGPCMEALY